MSWLEQEQVRWTNEFDNDLHSCLRRPDDLPSSGRLRNRESLESDVCRCVGERVCSQHLMTTPSSCLTHGTHSPALTPCMTLAPLLQLHRLPPSPYCRMLNKSRKRKRKHNFEIIDGNTSPRSHDSPHSRHALLLILTAPKQHH